MRVLEISSGKEVVRIQYDKPVREIAFSPDGKYFASGSVSGEVFVWEAGTGKNVTALSSPGSSIVGLSFRPGEGALTVGTETGTALLWDLSLFDTGTEVEPYLELACSRAVRNFTRAEWGQYLGEDNPYQPTCPNLSVLR
jgi:WD40 repeat protein